MSFAERTYGTTPPPGLTAPRCKRFKFCAGLALYFSPIGGFGQLCEVCTLDKNRKARLASARRRAIRNALGLTK